MFLFCIASSPSSSSSSSHSLFFFSFPHFFSTFQSFFLPHWSFSECSSMRVLCIPNTVGFLCLLQLACSHMLFFFSFFILHLTGNKRVSLIALIQHVNLWAQMCLWMGILTRITLKKNPNLSHANFSRSGRCVAAWMLRWSMCISGYNIIKYWP